MTCPGRFHAISKSSLKSGIFRIDILATGCYLRMSMNAMHVIETLHVRITRVDGRHRAAIGLPSFHSHPSTPILPLPSFRMPSIDRCH
jgi:hypothetical protein